MYASQEREGELLALLIRCAEQHVVHHAHLAERLGQLEGPHHPHLGNLVRRHAADFGAVELPLAGVGFVEAGEQVEEGGLAGPVRADERRDDAPLDFEVVDVDGLEPTEVSGHSLDAQNGVGLLSEPGCGSTVASSSAAASLAADDGLPDDLADIEQCLFLLAEQALWTPDHQCRQHDAHHDETDTADVVRVDQPIRDPIVFDQLADCFLNELQ